jgi:hypothetical protein
MESLDDLKVHQGMKGKNGKVGSGKVDSLDEHKEEIIKKG